MSNSEKFKTAVNMLMEEFHRELKNEEIDSVKLLLTKDDDETFTAKKSHNTRDILNGFCFWDPVRKRIVCRMPH